MATLDAALALAEMDDIALAIGSYLNLDVVGALDQPFQVQATLTEIGLRLLLGDGKDARELVQVVCDPHPAPAAAGDGLEHERKAELAGCQQRGLDPRHRLVCPGQHGDAGRLHQVAGAHLVAERPDRAGAWADEADAHLVAHFSQVGVFGQEAVPRMNRIGMRNLGRADHIGDVEIASVAGWRPNADRFVSQQHPE